MAKRVGIESVESVLARMKPENIAKHYVEYKEKTIEQRNEIERLQKQIRDLEETIEKKDATINRLKNEIKYSGVKKTKLDITAVEVSLTTGNEYIDGESQFLPCLNHYSEILYSYHIDTGGEDTPEWIGEDTSLRCKGATISGIDSNFDNIRINNVYEIVKDGKQIYRATDEAFEDFK